MKLGSVAMTYTILEDKTFSKMEVKELFRLIDAMNEMRPLCQEFKKDIEQAQKALASKEHTQWLEKGNLHNKGELTLCSKELEELNAYFESYNNRVSTKVQELENREVKLKSKHLSAKGFEQLISSIKDDVKMGELLQVKEVLS